MKPYRLQLLQAVGVGDRAKGTDICDMLLEDMEGDTFYPLLIFNDKAPFHLSGKVSCHSVRIWGLENPHEAVKRDRDSPKINVFSAVSVRKIYDPFLKETLTGNSYLENAAGLAILTTE